MSVASEKRSAEFLKIADQFKLGSLVTEASHPATARLSETAKSDIPAALRQLFDVDEDVVRKYREFVESGRAGQMADMVLRSLKSGGRIFFTGCGSTGRLSILLVSIWRDFWQQRRCNRCDEAQTHEPGAPLETAPLLGSCGEEDWEHRAHAVMAGGDYALIKAVEGFEDYTEFGKKQIGDLGVCEQDVVFAITEGGETSFVIGTALQGVEVGAKVFFVYNNPDEILCEQVQRSREVIRDCRIEKVNLTTGPMAITGSTRMQATSIQLAVMVTVLEMVVRDLTGQQDPRAEPEVFLSALREIHNTLKSANVLPQLARLVSLEESVYRAGRKNNYFANRVAIDLLTDTTERSPTYCIPPFRKFDDTAAAESWAFLYVPYPDSPAAWAHVCKRTPRCVGWKSGDVRGLVPEDKRALTLEIVSRISYAELMRFRIGLNGLENRPPEPGDCAVGLVVEGEEAALRAPDGFFRMRLEEAHNAGARTGLIFVGSENACREVGEFIGKWNPECVTVLLPVPRSDFLLNGVMRVGLKMLLNALSTGTMVRLGRVMGNTMIWVVPSNLKLIDRATRYLGRLANLDYETANRLLFEVIEYVEPRMKADQAYPPVVGVAVLRARHGLTNEEAERRVAEELG